MVPVFLAGGLACTSIHPPEDLGRRPFAECTPRAWGGWHVVWPTGETAGTLEVAWWWVEKRRPYEAVDTINVALDYLPENESLLEARAALYHDLRFHRAAEVDFQTVATLRPGDPGVWRALARVRLAMASPDRALQAIDRARALGDESGDSYELEARAQRAAGRTVEAWGAYERAIAVWEEPLPDLLLETATLALAEEPDTPEPRLLRKACELTRVAIDVHPGEAPEAWLVRALVLDASGEPDEAVESYRRAGELDPAGHGSWAYMARLSRGRRRRAS